MPTTNSNTVLYATYQGVYDTVNLPSGTAVNTYTLVTSAGTNGSIVTDLLFRNSDTSNIRNFNIIIAPTGSQAVAQYNIVQVVIASNAGAYGTLGIATLSSLSPSLFDIDLAGNRVITLEAGQSIYVQNTSALIAPINIMAKKRNY